MVRFDRADLWHRDEQVEHLGGGEVVGTGGEDLLEVDLARTQILFEFRLTEAFTRERTAASLSTGTLHTLRHRHPHWR